MFIESSARGYDRNGQQVVRRARFLILVSLDSERTLVPCDQCAGFGRYVADDDNDGDLDSFAIRVCHRCERIPCSACDSKGWTYDETRDEHANTCPECRGSGYLGPSGKICRYVHHKEIRALVRKVAMHQCGHFMMGSARAFGHKISLSGSYGGDGLTVTVPREVFERAVPIPAELHEAWNKGGGWNSAGSEAPAMRAWALANLDKLESRKVRS